AFSEAKQHKDECAWQRQCQLQEKGLIIMIRSGTCSIYHPHKGLILQTNMTSNRMFILFAGTPEKKEAFFNTITQNEEDKQWSWSTNNKEAIHEDLEWEDNEFAKDDNEQIDINTNKEGERAKTDQDAASNSTNQNNTSGEGR
ncbi:Retrovirus-related Pol polyprotein from transposon TNT 1-94, partial [Sesbania bispinosa]